MGRVELNEVVRKEFSEERTFQLKSEEWEGNPWGVITSGRENGKCKCPEVANSLIHLRQRSPPFLVAETWFRGKQFFHRLGWGWGWRGDDSSTLHLLYTLILLLLHQLHLTSPGSRSRRLGTLDLRYWKARECYVSFISVKVGGVGGGSTVKIS